MANWFQGLIHNYLRCVYQGLKVVAYLNGCQSVAMKSSCPLDSKNRSDWANAFTDQLLLGNFSVLLFNRSFHTYSLVIMKHIQPHMGPNLRKPILCIFEYPNNKSTIQPVHSHRLIRICYSLLCNDNISSLYPIFLATS